MKQPISKFRELSGLKGRVRVITKRAGTEEVLRVGEWSKNLVMLGTNTGKSLILQRLNATNTYSLNISHGEIGTGNTAPAASDTALDTPEVREAKAVGSISTNILTMQFFFPDADLPNDTYYEFGTFVDGSGTLGSGQIFNRALFGIPYEKGTNEDTTVEVEFTLT